MKHQTGSYHTLNQREIRDPINTSVTIVEKQKYILLKTHILFVDMSQYPLGESLDPDVESGIVDPATFLDV